MIEGLGIGELATNLAIGKVARLADAVEKDEYVSRAMRNIAPYLAQEHVAA
jgi:hypothetical protein